MLVDINHAPYVTCPYDSTLQGNPDRFRMTMLARALRFRRDENT
jgi:hypothetical protein